MNFYITHCCKEKDKNDTLMPAIERYTEPFIKSVYDIARSANTDFLIFSGKFGFIKPDAQIPYYDKLLTIDDFDSLFEIVKTQQSLFKITSLTFFHIDTVLDPKVKTYINFIKKFGDFFQTSTKFQAIYPQITVDNK